MKKKLRQAYLRGMIDLSMFLVVVGNMAYFGMYVIEKYFMQEEKDDTRIIE